MTCRIHLNQPLLTGTSVTLPSDLGHYLLHVMRQSSGDSITLFNGQGGEFHGIIDNLTKQQSSCQINKFDDVSREMGCRVHIIQAACRSEKIETVLQKGTELGAASFHITRSERSSLKLDGNKLDKKLDRWRKIIIEAAEQSGRTRIPELIWHDRLGNVPCSGTALILHPHAAMSWQAIRTDIQQSTEVSLAIGPEGGWNDTDIATLTALGFQSMLFGPRILRTETAAPALLAAIQAVRDD
ncbi:MAG: 16S rRNA (uracil(1498)-N(3))-methyltransferase [Mariprofundus sp.]